MRAISKLSWARTQLLRDAPFFGSLALRLVIIEDDSMDTAYTDGVVLAVNPEFAESLSKKAALGLVAHEAMHLACLHHTRRDGRDPARWNIACDLAINPILVESGFELPAGKLLSPYYTGHSIEWIYDRLPVREEDLKDMPTDLSGDGEVWDAPVNTAAALKQVSAHWRVNIAQAAQEARAAGNLPRAIRRHVKRMLDPVVDWQEYLRLFIERVARNNYNWLPPARRYLAYGLCLAGLNSRDLGRLVIALDTTGRIDAVTLDHFAVEISSILEEYDTEIDVLYCDSQVRCHEHITKQGFPFDLVPIGGDGKDFRPVFDWVEKEGVDPACLIYLTDLECDLYPDIAPDYPVLWVQWGRVRRSPPFGEVVLIET
jgi:predicted metal-dependent peptidase